MLPNYTQVARLTLPAGKQQISFHHRNQQQTLSSISWSVRHHTVRVPGRLALLRHNCLKTGGTKILSH